MVGWLALADAIALDVCISLLFVWRLEMQKEVIWCVGSEMVFSGSIIPVARCVQCVRDRDIYPYSIHYTCVYGRHELY